MYIFDMTNGWTDEMDDQLDELIEDLYNTYFNNEPQKHLIMKQKEFISALDLLHYKPTPEDIKISIGRKYMVSDESDDKISVLVRNEEIVKNIANTYSILVESITTFGKFKLATFIVK